MKPIILDQNDIEHPFPFEDNRVYHSKLSKKLSEIIDLNRKRQRCIIFVVPNQKQINKRKEHRGGDKDGKTMDEHG